MKRHLLWILLATALLLTGCGKKTATTNPPQQDNSGQDNTEDTDKNPSFEDGDPASNPASPDDLETLELDDFADMEKAADALMLNIIENGGAYDSQDPAFFWSSLYYGIVNHTKEVPLAEWVDDEIRVPRMAVQEFATGLFADYSDLPELPASISMIRYDEEWDAYLFAPSDRGLSYPRLISAVRQTDGDIRLAAVLCDEETDKPYVCYVFTLTPNAYADGIAEPMFRHSILGMKVSNAVNSEEELPTLICSYQDFLDQNTVEFKIDSNLITFQVYDQDIITLLSEMDPGDEVTLAVSINEETEIRTIKSLIMK